MANYFDLFALPVSLHPPQEVVKKKFYELSRQFHPDRFAAAGAAAADEALKMSASVNAAYKVLQDADATMSYVLKLEGLLEDEEKYTLPPDFLMEMMDLNEAVSDYEENPSGEAREAALGSWQQQQRQLEQELKPLTEAFDAGDHSRELLLRIKDYYFRKKYLLRVGERLRLLKDG